MTRTAMALALGVCACATAPVAPARAPEPSYEQKLSWILMLEDQRVVRVSTPAEPPRVALDPQGVGRLASAPRTLPGPDLVLLLSDGEARVRRRAALALGRVGLPAAVPALSGRLKDSDPEVRQMAAFALGLIGDEAAAGPLASALGDASFAVKGSAAEALGRIGGSASVQPIERMAAELGSLADLASEPIGVSRDTPGAAFRLSLYALARLKAYEALAAVVLDSAGHPRMRTWPVAYALQQVNDDRVLPALMELLREPDPYTRTFAAMGLGAIRSPSSGAALLPLVSSSDRAVAVAGLRSLARLKYAAAVPRLLDILRMRTEDPRIRVEAVAALSEIGVSDSLDRETSTSLLIDLLGDSDPVMRAAAIRALASVDPEGFMTVLSGLDSDAHWIVRAALASVLGTMPSGIGLPRLRAMLDDPDSRVIPPTIDAIAGLGPEGGEDIFIRGLAASDPMIRAAAAEALARRGSATSVAPLVDAYHKAQRDGTPVARVAILTALAAARGPGSEAILSQALEDPDWAVRTTAAGFVSQSGSSVTAAERIRPAPVTDANAYQTPRIVSPPFSTQAYVDTTRGLVQLELAVLDAPLTVDHFVRLARAGYFDGLSIRSAAPGEGIMFGGDGAAASAGPAYSVRAELNELPYLRGVVGMRLEWGDAGANRFFITASPQPQLDGRHTVIGRVVSGIEVIDELGFGDEIRRVLVWDGQIPLLP